MRGDGVVLDLGEGEGWDEGGRRRLAGRVEGLDRVALDEAEAVGVELALLGVRDGDVVDVGFLPVLRAR